MKRIVLSIVAAALAACTSASGVQGHRTQRGPVLTVDIPMNMTVSGDDPRVVSIVVVESEEKKAEVAGLLARTFSKGELSPDGRALSTRGPGYSTYDTGIETIDEFVSGAADAQRKAIAVNGPGVPLDEYPFPFDRKPDLLRAQVRADLRKNPVVIYRLFYKAPSSAAGLNP